MKNENTGKKAASAAGSMMRYLEGVPSTHEVVAIPDSIRIALMGLLENSKDKVFYISRVADLKTVVASDLTQAGDKGKRIKS